MKFKISYLFLFISLFYFVCFSKDAPFIDKVLNSTFRIIGDQSVGTCFMVGKRSQADPEAYYPIFITAAHVLDAIKSDSAVLFYRIKNGDNYLQKPIKFRINENNKKSYIKHKKLDIAAFCIKNLDYNDTFLIIQGSLANDNAFKTYDIKIGDDLFCLGYPYNIVYNETGLPILRSGKIASFPIIPSNKYPSFLFDFNVYPGNSGGPVFLISNNRPVNGSFEMGSVVFSIVGIIVEQLQRQCSADDITINKSLQLGQVINSNLIKEFIISIPDSLTLGTKNNINFKAK